jgi:trigger factor
MATITRENVAPLTDKITVALAKDDYYPQFEKSLKAYAKKATMQGFRPGQVPQGLVRKMYGQSIFSDEILKTVEKEVNNYLTEQNPEIFAQPLPTEDNDQAVRRLDMNNPQDLNFSFEIGLKPQVNVANLSQASITRHRVTVTDEMVNQEIEYYQDRAGQQKELETVESDDTLLTVVFTQQVAEGETAPEEKESNLQVKDFAESVRPQLIGLKKEDSLILTLTEAFSEETQNWLLRNLKLEKEDATKSFTITIKDIKYTEKHPLNEELFNQVFPNRGITNEEDFRAEVKKGVESYWAQQDRGQVDDQIYHYLLDHTTIDLPEGFLKKWIRQSGDKPKTEEEAEKSWPSFQSSLKWTLISDTLMKQYGIDIEEEDLRSYAMQQVMGYMGGQADPSTMPWLEDYVNRMVKDKKFVDNAENDILSSKLFSQLEAQVQYQDEWMSREDFIKQQEHHREHHHH